MMNMQKFRGQLLVSTLLCVRVLSAAGAEDHASAVVPESVAANAANETPALVYGGEQRVRTEDWNNITDFSNDKDDERRQMRYRTRVWLQYDSKPVEFRVGIVDEFYKKYALKQSDVVLDRLNLDEVVFESLSLSLKKLLLPGLSIVVGRQDIQRGEGFLIFDATSGDGSRTAYFNAANISYQRGKSKFEFLGILDPQMDRFLPIIHGQHKHLTEWDEQALGLYYTNRENKKSDIDGYYFYKKEVKDYRSANNPLFQPDRNISTVGARLAQRFAKGYSLTGEFAGQWGSQHANATADLAAADIRAGGGYLYAKKSFDTSTKPYMTVGYWAMSGDDPNSQTMNGFDPIFARWPKYSELYLYSMVPERGVSYWTNNRMLQLETGLKPIKQLAIRATFYNQDAFHPSNKSPTIFAKGTHRGENYQLRADYLFNEKLRGHILFESYSPGDFYAVRNMSYFVQAQIVYQFKGSLIFQQVH